jgi:hypothetical protein
MADCLKLIDDANNGRLSDETLEEIIADLQSVKTSRKAESGLRSVEDDIFERGTFLVKEAELAKKIERRNRYINILTEKRIMAMAKEADDMVGNPSLALEALLVGVNAPFQNAQRSVDSLMNAIGGQYFGGMVADLRKGDLLTKFNKMSGDFEREVARALSNLNRKNPLPDINASADAQAIAKIMQKYQRAALQRENKAGAYIRLKEGRVVRASHDPRRMTKVGKNAWVNYMMEGGRLEWSKTADGEFANATSEARRAFLERSYDAITTGVRLSTDRSEIGKAFTGPKNVAKSRSASSVFTFKDADTWYNYDQEFGKASLREAFVQDLQASIRSTALMEQLGTNPQAMFERVQKRLLDKHRSDATKVKQLKREGTLLNFKSMLDEVTGDINIGSHTPLARFMHGYRAIQTMAKLGGAAISAFSDVAFMASNRMYQGRSLAQAWGDSFSAVFKGMGGKEKRDFADRLGVGFEAQIGDFMSRFNASDDIPGRTSKYLNAFFKLNLLQPWTEANKRGVTLMIANDLGREAGKRFDKLAPDLQRLLGVYGIDAPKWEAVRKGVKKGPDGRDYIVPGEIPDETVRENVFNLLTNEANFSVPSPGARERAILRQGYRPGTFGGEAIRFVAQFKSFGVLGLTKNLGRQIYGTGVKRKRDIFARGVGGNLGLINTIVGSWALGYFVMQAKEVAKGREPRPPSAETLIAAALQGGGIGIYGDFLFGQANRFGGGTLDTFIGPGISTATDAIDLVLRSRDQLLTGDEDVRGDFIRFAKSNTPFANLFYTKQAMDYMIWYQLQETINPGYLSRMEKRIKRENDQEFWLPPSSVVSVGGGFR